MKETAILFFYLFIHINCINAQQPFPHLKVLNLTMTGCAEDTKIPIHYDSNLATVIDKKLQELPFEHPLYTNEMGADDLIALELSFSSGPTKRYYLVFSTGPSCDPRFFLYDIESDKYIARTSGLEIYIPGNETLYTTGHANSMFNERKKYIFNGSDFEELKPDFYYVGLNSVTLKPMTLFADEQLTKQLAQLPANYNIEVLVAKSAFDDNKRVWKYLVKTSLGLVGWTTIEVGGFHSIDVEGIYFRGD